MQRIVKTLTLGLTAIGAICCVFFVTPCIARADTSAAPVVTTNMGAMRGNLVGSVREFFGVPFAAPPVGSLRWLPPRPHAAWTGALDTTKPGNSCPQTRFRGGISGSEDCLYLNIYAPESSGHPLPVMVWIHGGTFIAGSGAQFNGNALADQGHLVVVTINYRLGPLGFLAHRALDTDSVPSGNYGLLDQQAALRWVKDNIAAFGGDPSRVTVAGESAGAISIGDHLVSPAAAGLFDRAILESGPFLHMVTLAEAEKRGDQFASALGCAGADVAACMRSKSTDEILKAIPANPISLGPPVWFPVMDGHLIPSQPAEAMAAGKLNKAPVINGSNHDEGTLFAAFGEPLTGEQFTSRVESRFGNDAKRVLAAYPLASYPSPTQASAAGFGDALFSCRILKAGELLSAHVPVYQYEFNDANPPNIFMPNPPFPFGAYHGSEIQYVFGTLGSRGESPTPAQRALSNAMMTYWINFIRSGEPGGNPRWERFLPNDPRILSLSPEAIGYESGFSAAHHCDLWNSMMR